MPGGRVLFSSNGRDGDGKSYRQALAIGLCYPIAETDDSGKSVRSRNFYEPESDLGIFMNQSQIWLNFSKRVKTQISATTRCT